MKAPLKQLDITMISINYSEAYLIIGQPSFVMFFTSPMHDRVWEGNIVQGLSACGQGLLPHDL